MFVSDTADSGHVDHSQEATLQTWLLLLVSTWIQARERNLFFGQSTYKSEHGERILLLSFLPEKMEIGCFPTFLHTAPGRGLRRGCHKFSCQALMWLALYLPGVQEPFNWVPDFSQKQSVHVLLLSSKVHGGRRIEGFLFHFQ